MKSSNTELAPRLRPFSGVEMTVLGSGNKMTFLNIIMQPGAVIPDHSHPNEQIGTCLQGEGEMRAGGDILKVNSGVSWTIPANEPHSFMVKGDRIVILYEAFSPPREDYLSIANG